MLLLQGLDAAYTRSYPYLRCRSSTAKSKAASRAACWQQHKRTVQTGPCPASLRGYTVARRSSYCAFPETAGIKTVDQPIPLRPATRLLQNSSLSRPTGAQPQTGYHYLRSGIPSPLFQNSTAGLNVINRPVGFIFSAASSESECQTSPKSISISTMSVSRLPDAKLDSRVIDLPNILDLNNNLLEFFKAACLTSSLFEQITDSRLRTKRFRFRFRPQATVNLINFNIARG